MLHTKSELENNLKNIIITEINNRVLIRNLNDIFSQKGFNRNIISALFNHTIDINNINTMELIAFTIGCYDILKLEKINPKQYFTKNELVSFKLLKYSDDTQEKIDSIILTNMIEINESNYLGRITHEQIYKYMFNDLFYYNFDSQREAAVKRVGTNAGFVAEPMLNQKSVEEIAQLIYDGEFEENEIILNIRLVGDEIEPQKYFEYKFENVGDLIITPELDINSSNFTVVDILDGFHRMRASIAASEKYLTAYGMFPEGGFDVRVVMKEVEEAKKVVQQSFKRSDTGKEHLESLTVDNYSRMVDNIVKSSNVLHNHIANTHNDMLIKNSFTHKILLKRVLEIMKVNVDSTKVRTSTAKKIGKVIDEVLMYIIEKYYHKNVEQFKMSKHGNYNFFAIYLVAAIIIVNNKIEDYMSIADTIYYVDDDMIESLRLNNKRTNIQDICNVFKNLINEVI